jgi:hypothetical protein
MLDFDTRLTATINADSNDIGIKAIIGQPFMEPCDLETFRSKMNRHLNQRFDFTIGDMRDRTMPKHFSKGITEYVASCSCAGFHREGLF